MSKAFLIASYILLSCSTASAADQLLEIERIDGTVLSVTRQDFEALGSITLNTPLFTEPNVPEGQRNHSVTGPLLRDLLNHFKIEGKTATAYALDAYQIDIPVKDAALYDVVLATEIDGKALSVRDRGPVWLIYPIGDHPELVTPVYESRSIWQLNRLQMK